MGALTFIIYDETYQIYNMKFTEGFLKMKEKGPDNTSYTIEHSQNINKLSKDLLKMHLTRSELATYLTHTFIYNYHRLSINDESHDGHQPFEDPISHQVKWYPELKSRPKRKLLCDGAIYNYTQLIESEEFSEKDIQSSCDVEVILPLYIKYGIEKTLNMLNGDFSLVLTENTNTFILKTMNIFCARDKRGVRPLWYINNVKNNFFMFTSDMISIPEFITNDKNYNITEVPPGTYWSYHNKNFTRYTDYAPLTKSISLSTKTDPQSLSIIYDNIKKLFCDACSSRCYTGNFGIIFDNRYLFDSYLLTSLMLECNKSNDNNIHIFFNVSEDEVSTSNRITIYKTFITFLENKYNSSKLQFHIVVLQKNDKYSLNNKDNSDNEYNCVFKYIKDNLKDINLKVLVSSIGFDDVWNNKLKGNYKNNSHGFEIRLPYLDENIINYIRNLDTVLKEKRSYKANTKPVDKYIIRKSFDSDNVLPYELLWN